MLSLDFFFLIGTLLQSVDDSTNNSLYSYHRNARKTLAGIGRMYSLGEVNFIQGMLDFGNPKNSDGLKPNAELRKDAKAPSYNIGTELGIS